MINVPQALANGVLAGVNPVFGLYSMIVGTTVAAFVTASVFMNVDSTSATALTAGEALAGVTSEEHLGYLVVLGLLVGLFMLVCGTLKSEFIIYRLMVVRSRILWGQGDAVHRFYQVSGLIIVILGALWALGLIWQH